MGALGACDGLPARFTPGPQARRKREACVAEGLFHPASRRREQLQHGAGGSVGSSGNARAACAGRAAGAGPDAGGLPAAIAAYDICDDARRAAPGPPCPAIASRRAVRLCLLLSARCLQTRARPPRPLRRSRRANSRRPASPATAWSSTGPRPLCAAGTPSSPALGKELQRRAP